MGAARMFKHILIPTDGSDLSLNAVRNGLKLAKEIDASITGYHAIQYFQAIS